MFTQDNQFAPESSLDLFLENNSHFEERSISHLDTKDNEPQLCSLWQQWSKEPQPAKDLK